MSSKKLNIVLKKKKGPKRAQKKGKVSFGKLKITRVSAPSATSYVSKGTSYLSYGKAPYHETYGTGLRVTGKTKLTSIIRGSTIPLNAPFFLGTATTGTYVSAACSHMISSNWLTVAPNDATGAESLRPTASSIFYNSFVADTSGLLTSHTCNTLGIVARNYTCSNFRKVTLHYVPTCPTTTTGSIALAPKFEENDYSYNAGDFLVEKEKVVETPIWKAISVPIINDKDMRKPASRLYTTTTRLDSGVYRDKDNNVDLMGPEKQFSIVGRQSETSTTTPYTILGHLWMEYVVDFYGMSVDVQIANYVTPIIDSFNLLVRPSGKKKRANGQIPTWVDDEDSKEAKVSERDSSKLTFEQNTDKVKLLKVSEDYVDVSTSSSSSSSSSSSLGLFAPCTVSGSSVRLNSVRRP